MSEPLINILATVFALAALVFGAMLIGLIAALIEWLRADAARLRGLTRASERNAQHNGDTNEGDLRR